MVMKLIKWLLLGLLALVVTLLVASFFISPKYSVTRNVLVAAPADRVYALLEDPRRWKDWTVWNQRDPQMQVSYFGPPTGAGAGWSWKSKSEGDGKMSFTAAETNQRVAFDLYFPDFDNTSKGELSLAAEGNSTRVTWLMNGDMGGNLLFRWMAPLMDRMVGPDFESGLGNLKALAEKG